MKRLMLIMLLAGSAALQVSAQSLETLVAIGQKPSCTVADFAAMVPSIVKSFPDREDLSSRLKDALAKYKRDKPLTKARASFMVARSLRVKTSLLFILLPVERYAFRALVGDGIFGSASSGGDIMSGADLLDFVSAIGRKY